MSRLTLQQAAQWCGGAVDPKYAQVSFLGANNDSREIQPGQLFVALSGNRDGHAFIPMAMQAGAAAVLCTHCPGDYPAIVAPNPRKALGDIARQLRLQMNMTVVGVTGSVGKSTTKEMLASVLERKYVTGRSPANHNNDIGLPMAILALPEDTQVAVLEMGMNHFGEMAYLTSIARPDMAVITNIGTMHIEHLGSRGGILKAKLEILQGLRPGGKLVLNGDEPMLWALREKYEATYFGMDNPQCQVRGRQIPTAAGGCAFLAAAAAGEYPVILPVEGRHYICDALAALAAAECLGVGPADICRGLADYRSLAGRQEVFTAKGYEIIKDCYNAGPESMAAALEVLGSRPTRRIAVLGDMLELGSCTQAEHYRIGRIAAANCDMLFTLGKNGPRVVGGALTGGMRPDRATACDTPQDLAELLRSRVKPGDTLLFKGSRGMKMEQVLELFLAER